MKALLVRFEPELLTRLRAASERNGISMAHLVRLIVEEWLKGKGF
jgi:predicted DNA-binding protein